MIGGPIEHVRHCRACLHAGKFRESDGWLELPELNGERAHLELCDDHIEFVVEFYDEYVDWPVANR